MNRRAENRRPVNGAQKTRATREVYERPVQRAPVFSPSIHARGSTNGVTVYARFSNFTVS